ncbi:MAG: pseudouridine synthase [Planctomycetota bacterium]
MMVTNISCYQFAALDGLKPLRERLTALCKEWGLKGTILLSTEGINLFVAGAADEIGKLLDLLRQVPGLEGLAPKVSESREQPFSRMLVKIKKEIIAFGVEGIDPAGNPAPRLPAWELKRWLDEGRPVVLLDTRNDYEVELGSFKGALPIGVRHFRDFPAAVAALPAHLKERPIVSFCTGGIRCEKAAPYLIREGFREVYQLDGGILKYFEECGGAHYSGECFVFDKRVGLAAELDESGHGLCYRCQSLITPRDMADPRTVEGVSCPRCFVTPEERYAISLDARRARIRAAADPLPGGIPADNHRPLRVHSRHEGMTVLGFLQDLFPHVPGTDWAARFFAGDIVDARLEQVEATRAVRAGERYHTRERARVEPPVNPAIVLLHEDEAIIVVNKPAPLPMHPSGRFNRNTLQGILATAYAPEKPKPAHRLDANTSGLAVFTRTRAFARVLQPGFEKGKTQKWYLARVGGHPAHDRFRCDAQVTESPGHRGSRATTQAGGLDAETEFEVLRRDADGTALLRVRPLTGRTNQIRVHLWHLGIPVLGDPMYLPGGKLGDIQTLGADDPPLNLHAWRLAFLHPGDGKPVEFEAPPPAWAGKVT